MCRQELHDAVYRFGQISAAMTTRSDLLLRHVVEVAADVIDVDVVGAAVYETGIEGAASSACVIGPWTRDESQRFIEQSRWSLEDRILASKLAGRPRGTMYQRNELIEDEDFTTSRLYNDFQKPMGLGDQALGLYRRSDGCELLIGVNLLGGKRITKRIMEQCHAVAPYMAQAWARGWRREPTWMSELKPQARRVLDHVLEGYDDDQIAERTGLTYHSVRAHLKRLFREAGVRSRLHLMQACRSMEVVEEQVAC